MEEADVMKLKKRGVEVDVTDGAWRKSTRSGPYSDNCVEVAVATNDAGQTLVGVRDSDDPDGAVLAFTRDEWTAFTGGVRDGEFPA